MQMPSSPQAAGRFYVMVLPDPLNAVFRRQTFTNIPGSGNVDGDTAIVPNDQIRSAEYVIFWTDQTYQAFLDPRVVVTGNGTGPKRTARRKGTTRTTKKG
jgi:hypothetical protein